MVAVKSRQNHRESPVECYHGESPRFAANNRDLPRWPKPVIGDLGKNREPRSVAKE
ncbi:hypothetical protein DPMN_171760 [Dreissena polymorpha]|uniref:Uncharacterized protein n=1 Tax=Dreissena polymorpha TaxID=45954 RepID=A0A9D4E0B2_DREPO|nr:hypothetical protein DPMN_171760 [Dreissena polymorpha]